MMILFAENKNQRKILKNLLRWFKYKYSKIIEIVC